MAGLAGSLFVDEEVDEDEIEKLKEGDLLESSFGEFAAADAGTVRGGDRRARPLHGRASCATSRRRRAPQEVLAVVGAGHLKGSGVPCAEDAGDPVAAGHGARPCACKSSKVPWFTLTFTTLLLAAFGWGFYQGGFDLGAKLVLRVVHHHRRRRRHRLLHWPAAIR